MPPPETAVFLLTLVPVLALGSVNVTVAVPKLPSL
jgi:hypothetical protein